MFGNYHGICSFIVVTCDEGVELISYEKATIETALYFSLHFEDGYIAQINIV